MAGDVTLDRDLLEQRLRTLIQLYDDVHEANATLDGIVRRQTSVYWSDEPSVTGFVTQYAAALRTMSGSLGAVRDRIDAMRSALADSARSLTAQDEQIADLFGQLATRYAAAPAAPVLGGSLRPGGLGMY